MRCGKFRSIVFAVCAACAQAVFAAEDASTFDSRPLLRIGYIESSFSPSERQAFDDTFAYLREKLPQYKFEVQKYLVRDLERGVRNNEFEFFIGSSGFFRRVFRQGLKDLATMTTKTAPDPNDAVGTVFMVRNDSTVKTVDDMKGLRAAANFEYGFSGVQVPLGEIASRGYNPDTFFREIVPAGSPMKKLLLALLDGRADVALSRACTVEELQQTEPEFMAQFRMIGLKPEIGRFACVRSTELYPNWTFVATPMAPWQASRDMTVALLSMPPTSEGVGWGVTSDFFKVDELFKTLRTGPYAYLRIQSVGDFVQRYWPFISLFLMAVLGLLLHMRRVTHVVDVRTRELRDAMQRQKDAMDQVQSTKERLAQFEHISVIGAMSSLIAHEINGPVSAISNSCHALERAQEDDINRNPMTDKTLALILRQCDKITRIVALVRNYARHREMPVETVGVVAGVEKIITELRLRFPNVRFELYRPDREVFVNWSHLEYELCLNNVIKNGAEACQGRVDDACVAVTVTAHPYTVELMVTDNAPTDKTALENCVSPLHSSKKTGLGLGLLIVRTLVEKTAGNVSIVREGEHTVARIRLPLKEETNV